MKCCSAAKMGVAFDDFELWRLAKMKTSSDTAPHAPDVNYVLGVFLVAQNFAKCYLDSSSQDAWDSSSGVPKLANFLNIDNNNNRLCWQLF